MNLLIIFYALLLINFFCKKQTFYYSLFTFVILLFLINTEEIYGILLTKDNLWFIFFLTVTYYVVIEVSKDNRKDIQFLKFLVWIGSLTIILSSNLIFIYIGLEIQTFSLFVLISKNRNLIKSSEAGLKYFILGALSSGFYLVSIITIYNLYNSLDLFYLMSLYFSDYYFLILISILSLSLFFKLSLFPLHFWIPDIYEGSSSDILSIMATLPKISILCFIVKLNLPLAFLLYCGLGSVIIGCLGGFNQTKIKRLLAYSSIAHLGFTFIALSFFGYLGTDISLIYFLIYIISSIGILLSLIIFNRNEDIFVIELAGLQFFSVLWGVIWSIFFLSLAGLPPLIGFLGKWWVILNTMSCGFSEVGLLLILFSCLSIGFYLRISKIIYFQSKSSYLVWYSVLKPNKKKEISFYIISGILYFSLFGLLVPNLWSCLVYFIWY